MVKSRIVLMIVGLIVLIMGLLALADISESFGEPTWHAVLKVLVGLAALILAYMDKE
jgi:uncharacterized membrane protein